MEKMTMARPLRVHKEIGEYFGISESGVMQASRRLGKKIEEDKKLKKKVKLTKSRLKLY